MKNSMNKEYCSMSAKTAKENSKTTFVGKTEVKKSSQFRKLEQKLHSNKPGVKDYFEDISKWWQVQLSKRSSLSSHTYQEFSVVADEVLKEK